jgi:two-component system, chemotaxis family, chemotaxis protein CheY
MADYTVLITEDSPTMRFFISFSLKRLPGLNVLEASDGVQAMKILSEKKVDLVIADVNMPLMNGIDLLTKVRQDPKLKEIPIVLCTTEEKVRDEGKKLGANAFLSKPVRQEELSNLVKEILKI